MAAKGKSSRWGSLLSGAVAGIESRLDTILADEKDASAKSRAIEAAATESLISDAVSSPPKTRGSSESTRLATAPPSRPSSRLQERLNKAAGTRVSSSLATSDSNGIVEADSVHTTARPTDEAQTVTNAARIDQESNRRSSVSKHDYDLLNSALPINPAFKLASSPVATATILTPATKLPEVDEELVRMHRDYAEAEQQRREETHAYLERIDALQAKLQYLAKETVAAAKQANASSIDGNEKKLAAKDERIALLMEEGEKLSKKELRNLGTIKRLNTKNQQDEREINDLKRRAAQIEQSESLMTQKVLRLEQVDRANAERLRQASRFESDVQSLRSELNLSNTIAASLRQALAEADLKLKQSQADVSGAVVNSKELADCRRRLEEAELGIQAARTEGQVELRQARDEAMAQKTQAQGLELELRAEIANLESRMENLRFKAEEASSDTGGDAQAKLLRQIETLQTQYSLAAENWRTIEGSLNGRIAAVELDRDEISKREVELRRKVRDLTSKARRLEDEVEKTQGDLQSSRKDLDSQRRQEQTHLSRIRGLEENMEESRLDFDRQRKVWEAEANARIEEEQRRRSSSHLHPKQRNASFQSTSPAQSQPHSRKVSSVDPLTAPAGRHPITRIKSTDSSGSLTPERAHAHQQSLTSPPTAFPWRHTSGPGFSSPPGVSRHGSGLSMSNLAASAASGNGSGAGDISPTPPTGMDMDDLDAERERDESETWRHGSGTIHDVLSATTVHAGPSVQLVERMSSSIRRLEAEKAAHRDELARISAQRDEAREQIVVLMRENERTGEAGTGSGPGPGLGSEADAGPDVAPEHKTGPVASTGMSAASEAVAKELTVLRKRYDACLEMLGEKEEECTELKGDVADLKRIYQDAIIAFSEKQ